MIGVLRGRTTKHRDSISHAVRTVALLGIICFVFELTPAHAADLPALTSVIVRGSTVYDAPQLFAVYREQLGKPIDVAGARAIVAALVSKYETDGYARPQVRVDDALVAAGVLRLEVFEARIEAVEINGNPGPHLKRLERLGEELRDDAPVTPAGMQAALRRMRELPGLTLAASTKV